MKTVFKIGIVGILVIVVAAVIVAKAHKNSSSSAATAAGNGTETHAATPPTTATALPRLVDLGSHTCIPCQQMIPILAELKKELDGRIQVEFIDVRENPDAGQKYGIHLIPTQIFYDASGKELVRHEGFLSKEDILAWWTTFGILQSSPATQPE